MSTLRDTAGFKLLRAARHHVRNWWNEALGRRPRIAIEPGGRSLRTLGTQYGGWTFAEDPGLHGATIISCGAGEDISFDLLFAATYGATVIIVDPTPRAALHVKEAIETCIRAARDGTLDKLELYGMRGFGGLDPQRIIFVERALWKETGLLKLFAPKNPAHVSHSALDFQNDYRREGGFIEVEATTYAHLVKDFGLKRLPLLKLDIEGAEIEVLMSLSRDGLLPEQICVEYDELLIPNRQAAQRVGETHRHLLGLGYRAAAVDSMGVNYLYLRTS